MTPNRKARLVEVLNNRQGNITVVLENVFDPHNISAVMRSCDAVGIQEIFVLNSKVPRHKKWGFKSSSSASKWLTVYNFEDTLACIEAVKQNYSKIFTTHLADGSKTIYEMDFTQSMALVFGNEHSGITDEMLAQSDGNFLIPQVGIIKSLNISVACAVTIFEAFRQKRQAGHYRTPRLHPEKRIALLEQWKIKE